LRFLICVHPCSSASRVESVRLTDDTDEHGSGLRIQTRNLAIRVIRVYLQASPTG
jgi:hypothetical protein